MDTTQIAALVGAIVTAGGAMAAAIKFGLGRLIRHTDRNAARQLEVQQAATNALIANAAAYAAFAAQLDQLGEAIQGVAAILTGSSPPKRRDRKDDPKPDTAPFRKTKPDPDSGDYER